MQLSLNQRLETMKKYSRKYRLELIAEILAL